MADFLEACHNAPREWQRISNGGLDMVTTHDTWKQYAERRMNLSRIFGFRKYISSLKRQETARYLHMFYQLRYRPLAEAVLQRAVCTASSDNFVFQ